MIPPSVVGNLSLKNLIITYGNEHLDSDAVLASPNANFMSYCGNVDVQKGMGNDVVLNCTKYPN